MNKREIMIDDETFGPARMTGLSGVWFNGIHTKTRGVLDQKFNYIGKSYMLKIYKKLATFSLANILLAEDILVFWFHQLYASGYLKEIKQIHAKKLKKLKKYGC